MSKERFLGEPAVRLENECLRAVILPGRGGKAASLFAKRSGVELLFQNPKARYIEARIGDDFSLFDASGFDDAFPSIGAGNVSVGGKMVEYPDHGEIWSAPFEILAEGGDLRLRYQSRLLPYVYEKEWRLAGPTLSCHYSIGHTGGPAFPYIWTMHGLFRTEPNLEIIFPAGVERVRSVFGQEQIGPQDSLWRLPTDRPCGKPYHFCAMPPAGAVKYYAEGKVLEGRCGLWYRKSNIRVEITYDEKKLPFLGFWATSGGFRGDHNCALEPCTGFYDNIETAQRLGSCSTLKEGDSLQFSVHIKVSSD